MNILKVLTSRRRLGNFGENAAAQYLRRNGYKIIKRNYIGKHGEIDIIASKDSLIAFLEVKTRNCDAISNIEARPAASVTKEKQRKLINVANEYARRTHKTDGIFMRMDIIEVLTFKTPKGKNKIKDLIHIENAFDMNTAYQRFSSR